MIEGRGAEALRRLRALLAASPRDALLVQEAAELITWSGRGDPGATRRAFLAGLAPHYAGDWWFAGEYAFELAEVGRLRAARRLARRALRHRPDHAGAVHALAHVCFEARAAACGAAFLRAWLPQYDVGGAEHSHLQWHLALFELARGRAAAADAVYAAGLDPAALPHRRLVDAASFLWWRRLSGPPAKKLPWGPVRDLAVRATRATAGPGAAFVDVHAAMAFAGAGDGVHLRRLLRRLRRRAAGGDATAGQVTLPLAQALVAFARGAYGDAARRLEAAMGRVPRLGGSNAQRALFAATLVEARRRANAAGPCTRDWPPRARCRCAAGARCGRRPSGRASARQPSIGRCRGAHHPPHRPLLPPVARPSSEQSAARAPRASTPRRVAAAAGRAESSPCPRTLISQDRWACYGSVLIDLEAGRPGDLKAVCAPCHRTAHGRGEGHAHRHP